MSLTSRESRAFDLIGRQQELAVLAGALDGALSGKGQMVMLAGEPGIGKTRLARELTDLADAQGAMVLWGWCHERRGAPPLWPWLQSIRTYVETADASLLRQDMGPGAADIFEILPELTFKLEGLEKPPPLDQEQGRFRLYFSITTFFKNVSRRHPLMLILDDLHWADESSLLLLEFLAREISGDSLMVVGTYRDNEVTGSHPLAQTLGSLVREDNFQRVRLAGLSRREVGEFVEARVGVAVSDAAVETLHRRTEGNPLFVGEVVSSVSPEELVHDQTWITGIPDAVRESILRRISRLPDTCNEILRTASVIGRDFDLPLLRALSPEIDEGELLEALDDALGIRIVESLSDGSGRYRFGHALIQQAVYEEIPPMRRAQSHAAVGETLEVLHQHDLDQHAGVLAHHFGEAQPLVGPEKLTRYSLMAGDQALAAYAHEVSEGFFTQGLHAKGLEIHGQKIPEDAEGAALLFGLAQSHYASGSEHHLIRAFAALSRAFEYFAQTGDVALAVAAASFPIAPPTGGIPGVAELLARALTMVPGDSHEAGRLLSRYGGFLGLADADYEGAQQSLSRAIAIARREEDTALEVQTLAYAADVSGNHLRWQESVENGLRALGLATGEENTYSQVLPRWWTVVSLLHMGDLETARAHASGLRELTERRSTPRFLAFLSAVPISFLSCVEGDWQSGREYTGPGMGIAQLNQQLVGIRALLEYETGEFDRGEEYLQRLVEAQRLSLDRNFSTGRTSMAIAAIARITGVPIYLEIAEAAAEGVISSRSVTPTLALYAKAALAMVAVQTGNQAAAADHYSYIQGQRGTMLWTVTTVDRLLGLLSQTMGVIEQAMRHLEDALSFCRKASYRPELAWTCYDYASALFERNGENDLTDGLALLDESLAISSELGMGPLIVRVTALQGLAGSKPVRTPAYPDGITQREAEVLRLITAGKTDREIAAELIISVNTVGNHVRSILNKTDAANRTEAAAYAARHGLAPDEKTPGQ
ncbi:MAG: hypothetical protein BZY80_06015 [SAR202 cluster bacterium Io17-Chloro-G2]|nr:MAG: hypothetical protein BZY80_06015 [SAR202 cluster bacterium Io17-Chloro-G2]